MACSLSNKCAKNLCKRTVLVQVIIKNVFTYFLEHSVETYKRPYQECIFRMIVSDLE